MDPVSRPIRPIWFVAAFALLLLAGGSHAAELRPKPTVRTPSVPRAAALFDRSHLDANNLDMIVTNFGSFAYDLPTGNAGLIYPKGTGKTAVFAAGPWIGAMVNGQVRVAVGEYAQEFTPGPMIGGTFQTDRPEFRNYPIDRFGAGFADYLAYAVPQGAPTDGLGNPALLGDAMIWSVYNDADPARHTNQAGDTEPLRVEIQQSTFAFNRTGPLGNAIFVKFRIANKGGSTLDQTYFGAWLDPDLGGASDDLVGCDTTLSLGFCYNATNADLVYGSAPPAVGVTLLQGPTVHASGGASDTLDISAFAKYIGGTDPADSMETYNHLAGLDLAGNPIHEYGDPQQPITRFQVSGDPVTGTGWLDANPADRRLLLSVGPFTMSPGDTQEVVFAIVVGGGTNRLASIGDLRSKVSSIRSAWPTIPVEPAVLQAGLDLDSNVLNLLSRAPSIAAYVEPQGFDVYKIDWETVRLDGTIAPIPGTAAIGDHDQDGEPDLALQFSWTDLVDQLTVGPYTLEATGILFDGSPFHAAVQVQVIDPASDPHAPKVVPNPLNPSGTLTFRTTQPGLVRVTLSDVRGRLVRTIVSSVYFPEGRHEVTVDGRSDQGVALASGVYWARVESVGSTASAKVVIVK